MLRSILPLTLALLVGVPAPARTQAGELPTGRDGRAVEARDGTTLAELAEEVRAQAGVPALAVATVEGGRVVETAVVGHRSLDDEQPNAGPDDRFHVGSVTKSMTASMIGRLVERGELELDVLLGDALAQIDMPIEYAECTLLQVLQHRAGLPSHMDFGNEEFTRLNALPGNPTEQRAAYVAEVLSTEPQGVGGFRYSNAGYAVAGLVAERATGRSWEDLMQSHVFEPLGMKHSGLGWPATAERPDQPRGHYQGEQGLRVQGLEEYTLGAFLAPAGDVHASVHDLARYAAAHLDGLLGREGFLKPETVRELHEPLPGAPYACGWLVRDGVHFHNGSAGTFHAVIEIEPAADRALVVMCNAPDAGESLASAIRAALAERREAAKAGAGAK